MMSRYLWKIEQKMNLENSIKNYLKLYCKKIVTSLERTFKFSRRGYIGYPPA